MPVPGAHHGRRRRAGHVLRGYQLHGRDYWAHRLRRHRDRVRRVRRDLPGRSGWAHRTQHTVGGQRGVGRSDRLPANHQAQHRTHPQQRSIQLGPPPNVKPRPMQVIRAGQFPFLGQS